MLAGPQRARKQIGFAEADLFAPEFTTSGQKLMKLCPKISKLLASRAQSEVMHGKTIARSHSVLMHVCMAEDFIQLSIKRPTDIGAGCALLAGKQQPVAWFETGFGFLVKFWV